MSSDWDELRVNSEADFGMSLIDVNFSTIRFGP